MIETILAAAALATTAQGNDDLTARAIAECGYAEFDITTIEADSIFDFEDFGTQLEAALGEKIIVISGDLTGADMRGLSGSLLRVCFYQTKLSGTDWRGANLVSSKFIGTDLSGANFEGAYLTDAKLIGVDASHANFANAKLGSAKWIGQNWASNLEGASFAGADMTGFTFDCGITMDMSCGGSSEADFSGADLTDANLASFPIWGFDTFDGATFNRTYISARSLPYLGEIDVTGRIFLGYKPEEAAGEPSSVAVSSGEFLALVASNREAGRDVPAFDCTRAASIVEKLICGEHQSALRRLDRDMAALYADAKASGMADTAGQRAWLKRRDLCIDTECIEASYSARMEELFGAVAMKLALAPAARSEYQEDVLPVTDTMRSSALYQRIIPALRMASMQEVTLIGREDGSISARGEAVGGNAHTCSLDADELIYDRATGWYSAMAPDGSRVPLLRVWGPRLFFRYSGNADTPEEAQDYIGCGVRAAFGELRALGR